MKNIDQKHGTYLCEGLSTSTDPEHGDHNAHIVEEDEQARDHEGENDHGQVGPGYDGTIWDYLG